MALDLDRHIRSISKGELLPEQQIKVLCENVKDVLRAVSNVKHIEAPLSVVSNIHGHFHDLLETFRVGGPPPDVNYVFLGGYVGYGYFSVETITLLFCLLLRFPERVTLLRGRSDTRVFSKIFGFYDEVIRKYGTPKIWYYINEVFDYLPLGALVSSPSSKESIFLVHGGLSEEMKTISQIQLLDRFCEVPATGNIHNLLSSVPDQRVEAGFADRDQIFRSFGQYEGLKHPEYFVRFGADVFRTFCEQNALKAVIRGSQLCIDGYQPLFGSKLYSIWGAPNFFDRCGNVGAIAEIDDVLNITFNCVLPAPASQRIDRSPEAAKPALDFIQ